MTAEVFLDTNILQISQWDASIIAAALELGCHTLYSEDLNSGQDYSGIRVINPF
jgi:predicted nucleic acid-binding protein